MTCSITLRHIVPIAILIALQGCTVTPQKYIEPKHGERSRVRLIGLHPSIYTSPCIDPDAKPAGSLRQIMLKGSDERDLGIPKPHGFNRNFTETWVAAERPVTVAFATPQPVAPPGYYVVPAANACPARIARTFVPKAGLDYEVALGGLSRCGLTINEVSRGSDGSYVSKPANFSPPRCAE